MKLVDDPQTASWLETLTGSPDEFDWDAGNVEKFAKHGVAAPDVQAIFTALVVFAGRIVEPVHDEPRWLVLGRSRSRRHLALVLTRRESRLRPISCRSMRHDERQVYEEAISSEEEDDAPHER